MRGYPSHGTFATREEMVEEVKRRRHEGEKPHEIAKACDTESPNIIYILRREHLL